MWWRKKKSVMIPYYRFDPTHGCPVCGVTNEFKKFSDIERLEPDEEWCEFCGYHWQETGEHHHPPDATIDDYRDELMERCEFFKQHGEMIVENIQKLRDL